MTKEYCNSNLKTLSDFSESLNTETISVFYCYLFFPFFMGNTQSAGKLKVNDFLELIQAVSDIFNFPKDSSD